MAARGNVFSRIRNVQDEEVKDDQSSKRARKDMLSDATFLRKRDMDVAEKAEQENDQEMQ